MTDARRIAKLEAQVAALRARLSARTDQLLLVLLQIDDLKKQVSHDTDPGPGPLLVNGGQGAAVTAQVELAVAPVRV